ncbi:MAG: peptidylprolyl isomerase [Patescibacteria group bacterium]
MRKYFFLIFLLFLTGCAVDNPNQLTEKTAPGNMPSYNELDVVSRMNAIKNGLTPKIKPSGKVAPASEQAQGEQAADQNRIVLEPLADQFNQAIIKTNFGDIKVEFYGNESPLTVNNFLNLAKKGFYNSTKFHRVIKDFMIQTGDPNSRDDDWSDDGQGGPGYQFQDEINSHKLVLGSLAMANSGPGTNGSQFFIITASSTPWLDSKHTNFGQVVAGLDVVKKIAAVEINENDHPLEDIIINSVELINSSENSEINEDNMNAEGENNESSDSIDDGLNKEQFEQTVENENDKIVNEELNNLESENKPAENMAAPAGE